MLSGDNLRAKIAEFSWNIVNKTVYYISNESSLIEQNILDTSAGKQLS
jgi:hypothetical protein